MKSFFYTIALYFISLSIYCQDYEYLKKTDTIYIEFNGNKNEKKYSIQTRMQPTNFDERAYHFFVKNKLGFYFQHPEYKNGKKQEMKTTSGVKKVNKSFIKEHQKNIIGIDFLKKYNSTEMICDIFTQLKVFYIIDYSEKKKGTIMLYEVNCLNYCPSIE